MSILSDLIVAPASAAEAVGRSPAPAREFGGASLKGIDTIKLASLHAQLTGKTIPAVLPDYEPVAAASDDGPWVFALPPEFVHRLATLGTAERDSAGGRWAETEEFILDRWPAPEVRRVLETLCGAAEKAQDSGDALLLWMSL